MDIYESVYEYTSRDGIEYDTVYVGNDLDKAREKLKDAKIYERNPWIKNDRISGLRKNIFVWKDGEKTGSIPVEEVKDFV